MSILCMFCRCSNELGDNSSNLVVDGESERDIEDNSGETRANTLVETANTLVSEDIAECSNESTVLSSLKGLQVSLDHINWIVEHNGAEASETT